LGTAEPQTEPKRKSRRFYLVLAAAVLLIATISIAVFLGLFQTNYGIGPVDIEVTPNKPVYLQGEEVNFTIYVNNPHDWPVAYPFQVAYRIEKGNVPVDSAILSIDFAAGRIPTFPAHSNTTYCPISPWNQKTYDNETWVQVEPGNYTFTVSLKGPSFDNSGNCTFEIRQSNPS